MKIALLGTRGVPASYSGFETCVEQLGQRLAQRGHQVTVYCRSHHISYPDPYYKGMRLVKLPTIRNKYLDTIVHSFLSSLHSLKEQYDIALYFIAGNSVVTWIPKLVGTKTIINVDGLDWKRKKWPSLAKKYIQFSEYIATRWPDAFLTDSRVIQQYYQNTYKKNPWYIPYGSEVDLIEPGEILKKYGLNKNGYVLFVGRLVPENCVDHIIEAFHNLETDLKCVIVGDAPYSDGYKKYLQEKVQEDPRIIFTGYVFGKGYNELGSNSLIFVESSGVGGTHPALTEAMAFGNCVVVHDTPENIETIGEAGLTYNGQLGGSDLKNVLDDLLRCPSLIEKYRDLATTRAKRIYNWGIVTDQYEELFLKISQQIRNI